MKILTALVPLAFLGGCTTPAPTQDLFAGRANFAAQRQLESTIVRDIDHQLACAQVTSVLMDLDCNLQEINSELGLISAYGSIRMLPGAGFLPVANLQSSCGGKMVTVSVRELGSELYGIRATFTPADPRADQAFRSLLLKSLQLQSGEDANDE